MNTTTTPRTGFHNARELTWTLAWLRLCAVAGQALTVAVVAFGMQLPLPLTGVTFPFVSFGMTSLVANMAMLGLAINVTVRPGTGNG